MPSKGYRQSDKLYYRLLVAAMHFNENFGRPQAVTVTGQERMQIAFKKQNPGEFTPKIVPVPKTYSKLQKHHASQMLIGDIIPTGYANSLLQRTIELCTHEDNKPQLPTVPPPLASQYEHPDKDTIPLFSRYKH